MSASAHMRAQLSAYVDDALSPAERSAVDAHLATCPDCRARLADLRATARLIASLPSPVPTRRLVPRVAGVPGWLAPLRTLSTLASGVAVFLFIATALLANIDTLATASATTASQAPLLAPGAAAVPQPASQSPSAQFRNSAGASAPTAAAAPAAQDATKSLASVSPSPSPTVEFRVFTSSEGHAVKYYSTPFASPWLWLVVAVLTGVLAILLQRRLRQA